MFDLDASFETCMTPEAEELQIVIATQSFRKSSRIVDVGLHYRGYVESPCYNYSPELRDKYLQELGDSIRKDLEENERRELASLQAAHYEGVGPGPFLLPDSYFIVR